MTDPAAPDAVDHLTSVQLDMLPGVLGLVWDEVVYGRVRGRFAIERRHMAPNGFLHAASLVALADTACGYGAGFSKPDGAIGFTTIELKSNFLGTAREGTAACEARLVHGGRTTQLWDAEVKHVESGRTLALFRCTQLMLYPKG